MRKNEKGFSHLELILIFVVVALIGGAGFYVFKQNNKHQDASTSQQESDNTSQNNTAAKNTTELKEYKNTEHEFSFSYPSDWKLSEDLKDIGRGGTEGDVVVTSPSGTKVHFGPNYGGKGGDCIDDQTGTETTRTCPTMTVYATEKVPTNQGVAQVYFYQASVTASLVGGCNTKYMIFISNNSFYPTQPKSVLGGGLFLPHDEVTASKASFTIYVEGKDTTNRYSKIYFDSAEAKEATPILKSFRAQ